MFNAVQQQRMAQQAGSSPHIGSPMLGGAVDGNNFPPALRSNPSVPGIARSTRTPSDHAASPMTPQLGQRTLNPMQDEYNRAMMGGGQRNMNPHAQAGGMGINTSWPQNQHQNQQSPQQMGQPQGGFGMATPGSAGGYSVGMAGNSSSPHQQWNQGGQFPFSAGSPAQQSDVMTLQPPRQASATPAPLQQQQPSLAQNSPMGEQTGLNDFDIFNWAQ